MSHLDDIHTVHLNNPICKREGFSPLIYNRPTKAHHTRGGCVLIPLFVCAADNEGQDTSGQGQGRGQKPWAPRRMPYTAPDARTSRCKAVGGEIVRRIRETVTADHRRSQRGEPRPSAQWRACLPETMPPLTGRVPDPIGLTQGGSPRAFRSEGESEYAVRQHRGLAVPRAKAILAAAMAKPCRETGGMPWRPSLFAVVSRCSWEEMAIYGRDHITSIGKEDDR